MLKYWWRTKLDNGWFLTILLIFLLVSIPILYILFQIFNPPSETWLHIKENLLADYVSNTILLSIGVACLTLLLGIPSAWLVSMYEFPLRGGLSWWLILPLAIPTYINAAVYKSMLGSAIMNMSGAVCVIAFVLYPYIYLISRSAFEKQSQSVLEVAKILGKSRWQSFFSLVLPLARPAVFGGLFLVLMEVFNEYGAVKYYNINTFTKGIFRAWFSLGDVGAAVKLSAYLMIFVFILVGLEAWQRKKQRFHDAAFSPKPIQRVHLKGLNSWLALIVCFIPALFGFVIPLLQLLYWASTVWEAIPFPNIYRLIGNSIGVASLSAMLITLVAILMNYAVRISRHAWGRFLAQVATLGYAIPGTVIAIGSMMELINADNWLSSWIPTKKGFWLNTTLLGLVYAYLVRFLAVGSNPIASGWQKISQNIDHAALLSGQRRIKSLFTLHLPLLKNNIVACFILVFVDTLKELPLTLILRPFNFDTLATTTFEMADDERFAVAGVAALLIIGIGLSAIFIFNNWNKD